MILTSIHNESDFTIKNDSINQLINIIFSSNNILSGKINIIIISDDNLRKMKKEYFNQDLYTDVIAFKIEENPIEAEIYISHDRVKDNSKKYNQSFHQEFKRVVIHGTLHLCGYNDSTKNEKLEMRSMEDNYLSKFKDKVLV